MITAKHLLHQGAYTLSIDMHEWTKHWVDCPVIFETSSKRVILDLSKTKWHVESFDETTEGVKLTLSKFPFHHHQCTLDLAFKNESFVLNQQTSIPLTEVKEHLTQLSWDDGY